MPAITRSMMVARSNSAKTPSIWTIIRPAGRRGVERLGGRTEADAGGVEGLRVPRPDRGPSATAGRPDRPERRSNRPAWRRGVRWSSPGRSELGPRHLIGEGADHLPVLLARHIGGQPFGLGPERVGLVHLVGRDPGVGGNPHVCSFGDPTPGPRPDGIVRGRSGQVSPTGATSVIPAGSGRRAPDRRAGAPTTRPMLQWRSAPDRPRVRRRWPGQDDGGTGRHGRRWALRPWSLLGPGRSRAGTRGTAPSWR